ncbi:DDB1- and CUL4-associated factor 11 [Geosmithia morbida]|uniref:DDB1- and CUL4-associated factor 11 n=1 Tax=Geosmithia morbida TaxID=1094350 RepID=A0A9P5D299_9HYPO|nr:DDB1- and CUL4-associated factor 11 [Geosmithia morbida]KAF4124803.1 DDB1- and CUL4-associated factor 11 [Geosmithia morbida]
MSGQASGSGDLVSHNESGSESSSATDASAIQRPDPQDDEDDEDDDDLDYQDEPDEVDFEEAELSGNEDDDEAAQSGQLNGRQMLALLQIPEVNAALGAGGDDIDEATPLGHLRFNRRARRQASRPPKVPSDEGTKLMWSGAFGATSANDGRRAKKNAARRVLERELGDGSYDDRKRNNDLLVQNMLPTTQAEHIIHYDDPVYSGQFSDDGNFFFSVCQDFNVRMYDTSDPYNWKHYKTVHYPWGQWTLTDASLSPDNRWLAYTSISSMVSIAPTDPLDTGDPYTLDLGERQREREDPWGHVGRGFSSIWSIRFSGDGRELVAGTNRHSIVVYDIESRRVLHHVEGHENDVNAVCFADKSSPHIIYSGSDDATIKVWDRRSMGDGREAGAFVGHTEGLTYIDSKGDGRYILSNGKDQSMKLWDLRMVMSTGRFRELEPTQHTRYSTFDYRTGRYDQAYWDHPNDNSIVTFRGHEVLSTLIRCHFSPPSATNSRYVYTGSRDGKVYVYNMDATVAQVIDVNQATVGSRPRDGHGGRFHRWDGRSRWSTCVRDASWHPNAPFIVASAWNGYDMSRGTCTLHSFNEGQEDEGMPVMSRNLNSKLQAETWGQVDDEDNGW